MTVPKQRIPIKKLRLATVADLMPPSKEPHLHAYLFKDVPEQTLSALVKGAYVYRAQPNVLVRAQDESSLDIEIVPLWYILEGHLHVERVINARSVVIGSLSPGQLCGEVENLLGIPSNFGISSADFTTFIEFPDPAVLLQTRDPQLLRNLCHAFAEKLRDRAEKAGIRRGRDIADILRQYLRGIVDEVGIKKRVHIINIRTSLTALSAQLGVSRQSIRNAFDKIKEFKFKNGKVIVVDKQIIRSARMVD